MYDREVALSLAMEGRWPTPTDREVFLDYLEEHGKEFFIWRGAVVEFKKKYVRLYQESQGWDKSAYYYTAKFLLARGVRKTITDFLTDLEIPLFSPYVPGHVWKYAQYGFIDELGDWGGSLNCLYFTDDRKPVGGSS